ncbi:hypothetical protein B0I35DRAFT_242300 [Stachybotrys elegans]|uniref:Uncharacterized protein n=1 Tax=Stachybotrys elegans TaxID=80388 RepID=A0A8K0SWE0_9HYPO|nr:hypothetical protein B0I35DRAFT_242300 [Stachybotrys elegans]
MYACMRVCVYVMSYEPAASLFLVLCARDSRCLPSTEKGLVVVAHSPPLVRLMPHGASLKSLVALGSRFLPYSCCIC